MTALFSPFNLPHVLIVTNICGSLGRPRESRKKPGAHALCITHLHCSLWRATSAVPCLSCRFVFHYLLRCCCVWEKSLQQASWYPDAKNTYDWLYFWGLTVISYYMAHRLWLRMMCPLRYSSLNKAPWCYFERIFGECVLNVLDTHPTSILYLLTFFPQLSAVSWKWN